jgi:transposase
MAPALMGVWRSAKKLSREKVLTFLAKHPRCVVAMEACGSAHHWGRAIGASGHEVRLIPPAYVKPFVRRQKNDAADAEAICEAAVRPTMRFVAVKTEEQQARAMLFRTRDLLVRQRTQLINALCGHLTEHGVVVPRGPANLKGLAEAIESEITPLPLLVVELSRVFLDQIDGLSKTIAELEKATVQEATRGATMRRLQPCRAWDRSQRWRLRLSRRRWPSSDAAATLPLGSGLFPGNIRRVASRFSARPRRWASATSDAC